ncbi:MAG: hypothetical protein J6X66_05460, partial [Lachnospiraceae bacterium]|nr:hypothetical protein [Lachnospiraceae bacterium]
MSSAFGMMGLETVQDEYLNRNTIQNCADETAAQVDEEVKALIRTSYEEAKRMLTENREILNKIADYLFEKETISGREFMEIYCREKGIPMPEREEGSDRAAVIVNNDGDEPKYTPEGKEIISVTRGRDKSGSPRRDDQKAESTGEGSGDSYTPAESKDEGVSETGTAFQSMTPEPEKKDSTSEGGDADANVSKESNSFADEFKKRAYRQPGDGENNE